MRNYGMSEESARRERLLSLFASQFGRKPTVLFSSPGGAELIGGITEHHYGKGVCTAISRDLLCAADRRSDDRVEIKAEGLDSLSFSVHDLENREREKGRLVSLARGILRFLKNKGYSFNGFSVYFQSELPQGSSFPAAFSVLLAEMVNTFYLESKLSPLDCAAAGTYAEGFTYGKSDAFSEHLAIVQGGCSYIDFGAREKISKLPFPEGYGFVLTDLCGIFDPLPQEIFLKKELSAVSSYLGGRTLSEVPFGAFEEALPALRRTVGDRAALCALHFYRESERAEFAAHALLKGDIPLFLFRVNESGEHFAELVKESAGADTAMLAMRMGELVLKKGACRLNGSSVLAITDEESRGAYLREMIRLFGRDRVKTAEFRKSGCAPI